MDVIVSDVNERPGLRKTSVEEKHGDIDISQNCSDLFFVVFDSAILGEIKHHSFCFNGWELGGDFCEFLVDFGLASSNNANVETRLCTLVSNCQTDTIRTASNNSPRVSLAVLA